MSHIQPNMGQVLKNLAYELEHTLGQLPVLPAEAGQLDDACARLDHVLNMTETATHRTLDLTEQSRELLKNLHARMAEINHTDPQIHLCLEGLQHNLSHISLTQSYQDITGQMIARVAGIVRKVHESFKELGLLPQLSVTNNHIPNGPSIAHLDSPAVSQNDADNLLSDLGL